MADSHHSCFPVRTVFHATTDIPQDGNQPGDANFMSPVGADASAAIPMTQEDAENMTVEDDRLAYMLGITEEPSEEAPKGCELQQAPRPSGQGSTAPQGVVLGASLDSGGDACGPEVGRVPRYTPPGESAAVAEINRLVPCCVFPEYRLVSRSCACTTVGVWCGRFDLRLAAGWVCVQLCRVVFGVQSGDAFVLHWAVCPSSMQHPFASWVKTHQFSVTVFLERMCTEIMVSMLSIPKKSWVLLP